MQYDLQLYFWLLPYQYLSISRIFFLTLPITLYFVLSFSVPLKYILLTEIRTKRFTHKTLHGFCLTYDHDIWILYALASNIEYTGRRKAILDESLAESNKAFPRPVYSILNGKAYNILCIIHYIANTKR